MTTFEKTRSLAFQYLAQDFLTVEREHQAIKQANRLLLNALDTLRIEQGNALTPLASKVAQLSVDLCAAMLAHEAEMKRMSDRLDEVARVEDAAAEMVA